MDNFMDKLAKRFNAGEIIKANAQAEARDMKRMQERTAEYERMMQEMRRLNLKNVEVTEQVQQLIRCGIEQFEGYGSGEALLGEKIDQANEKIDQTDELIRQEAAKTDESFYRIVDRLDEMEHNVDDHLRQDRQSVCDALRELEDKIGAGNGLDAAFERLETAISAGKYASEEGMREMSEMVRQMQENVNRTEEAIRLVKETLLATRMSVEEGQKRLEDHVHKENVRVYRNVQAVVADEATKKARDMGTRLDQLESSVKKTGGIKPLVILTFLLALASVGIQIAQILHLI